jgi:hypothetical protein
MLVGRYGRRTRTRSRWLGLVLAVTLVGAAVATELRKPAEERTWRGKLAGWVPYDLRLPTLARVHERLWNPADRRVLVPTVFGVGWGPSTSDACSSHGWRSSLTRKPPKNQLNRVTVLASDDDEWRSTR